MTPFDTQSEPQSSGGELRSLISPGRQSTGDHKLLEKAQALYREGANRWGLPIDLNVDAPPQLVDPSDITVTEAFAHYFGAQQSFTRGVQCRLNVARRMIQEFGGHKLTELADGLAEFASKCRTRNRRFPGRAVSIGSINYYISILRAATYHCVRAQIVRYCPKIRRISCAYAPDTRLEEIDIPPLLDALSTAPHAALIVLFNIYTALSNPQIFALRWQDVDFERNTIHPGSSAVQIERPLLQALKAAYPVRTCDHVVSFRGRPITSVHATLAAAFVTAVNTQIGALELETDDARRQALAASAHRLRHADARTLRHLFPGRNQSRIRR